MTYAKMALYIGNKSSLTEDKLHELAALVNEDEDKASEIINKAKISMGRDIGEVDMVNIRSFAERVVKLAEYRKSLYGYLVDKMGTVAPNLAVRNSQILAHP